MEQNQSKTLQERFLLSRGAALKIDGERVVQVDDIVLPHNSIVEIKFVGDDCFVDNAAAIAVAKPGEIFLSDGTTATALVVWDEPGLPREVRHRVRCQGQALRVYNKYRVRHRSGLVSEDRFTGNAGMVVTELGPRRRRYECSNALGPFNKSDLVFELQWSPALEE